MLYRFPTAATLVALRLDLLEHARRKLVLGYAHAMSTAVPTGLDDAVCRSSALTLLTDLLLLPLELGCPPVVKIAQGNTNLDFDVGAFAYAVAAKVSAAAEETTEEVEWIMMLAPASLLPLLETFVPILVVYFARFGINQGLIGFGYFYKLLLGSVVAAVAWPMLAACRKEHNLRINTAQTYGFLSGWNFLDSCRYADLICLSLACLSMPKIYCMSEYDGIGNQTYKQQKTVYLVVVLCA